MIKTISNWRLTTKEKEVKKKCLTFSRSRSSPGAAYRALADAFAPCAPWRRAARVCASRRRGR